MSDLKENSCPACGGTLKFDIKSQKVICSFCGSVYEKDIFRKLDEELNVKHADETNQEELKAALYSEKEAEGMAVYVCDSCGGEIFTSENTSSTTCPYCGSNVLVKSKLSGDLKPQSIIPFKVDNDTANNNIKQYFKKRFFAPASFKKHMAISDQNCLYVPYFLFNADAYGEASFRGEIVRTWSDSEYRYTETSYYRLDREGAIAFDDIPVNASQHINDVLMESVEPFAHNDIESFASGYLNGFKAERYDVEEDKCKLRANARVTQGTVNALRDTISGVYQNVRVENSNVTRSKESDRYALYPIYLASTSWNKKTYQIGVNGDTGKVAGQYPVSGGKVALVIILSAILGAAIGFGLGYFTQKDTGNEYLIGGIAAGVVAIIVGLIIGLVIRKKMKKQIALVDGAADYVRPGSFDLKFEDDVFLHKTVTKTKISNGK